MPLLAAVLEQLADESTIESFCEPQYVAESLGAMVDGSAYVNFVLRVIDVVPAGLVETIDLLWDNVLGLEPTVPTERVQPEVPIGSPRSRSRPGRPPHPEEGQHPIAVARVGSSGVRADRIPQRPGGRRVG